MKKRTFVSLLLVLVILVTIGSIVYASDITLPCKKYCFCMPYGFGCWMYCFTYCG